jgi:hypothetical protein
MEPQMNSQQAPATGRNRSRSPGGMVTAGILFSFALGGVVGFLGPEEMASFAEKAPALWIGAVAAAMAASFALGIVWMRSIDELAQRAHYVAWFWGGSLGLVVLMLVLLAAPALERVIDFAALTRLFSPVAGEAAGFTAGIFASLMIMMIGYGGWWLVYWLRKR